MAQNAKIAALSDELIRAIVNFDPATNRQAYKHAKDIAAKGLRGHLYARTNQFDIASTFAGLDEKFRIRDRDDLADALQARLQKLEAVTNKFKPDVLALLLRLADRPLENTQVGALELLRPPRPLEPLTWTDILHDDPYSEDEIWQDIDYAAASSEDERSFKGRAKSKSSPPTSVADDDTHDPVACIVQTEVELVKQMEEAQYWSAAVTEDESDIEITELDAIRETLYMLSGLRTSLFHVDQQQHDIRINSRYKLGHAMATTINHLWSHFIIIGKEVYRLRQWTQKPSSLALIQTFEAVVQRRLAQYDQLLSEIQQQYLTPQCPIAVSLLSLLIQVQAVSAPILRLAQIVSDIEPQLFVNPFSHLEALFDQTTLAQMTLEKETFDYLAELFFECLQTYLKPIRMWMESGQLGSDDGTFFVFANDSSSEMSSLWHDRFVLRRDGHNHFRTPTFLQPAVMKIFNTGKSAVFLKELNIHDADLHSCIRETWLDRKTVCGTTDDVPLSPFPELFQASFESWIRSKQSVASAVLRQHIFETGGLMRTLIAFDTLYLGKNGAVFEEFASAIFERMDTRQKGWNDRYVLTELARDIFGIVLTASDLERIVVRSMKAKSDECSVKELRVISIDFVLPWSTQNIIQRTSIPVYQQLFTFLLQAYRVKYLLQRVRSTRVHTYGRLSQLTYKLQHRLTWFTDILRSYLTETVTLVTTQGMETAMEKAEDIDEMSQIHISYVAKLRERAMLSNDLKPIYNAIIEILDLGALFADTIATKQGAKVSRSGRYLTQKKSSAAALVNVEQSASDSEGDVRGEIEAPNPSKKPARSSPDVVLKTIDKELARLLPFVSAGLKSVGRVGAEPMWEQLAERLDWHSKKERT